MSQAIVPPDFSNLKPEIYSRDEHPISRQDIDADALKIMYRLIRSGFKAYLVGGGVRDLLLGKKPKDYDITTDATPRRCKALFSNSRIIGRRFKLVHIFFGGGKIIEVSTFRDFSDPPEVEPDADNETATLAPDNKYGTEVTDALRRDITINGLFYDLSTFSIIDYVGGIRDLADRVIRVIGDPSQRFIEDPVRMLRVLRHAARTNFSIERGAWDAINVRRELITECPPMRVFEELKKDLCSGYFLPILRLLAQTQMLEFMMPELLHDYGAIFEDASTLPKIIAKIDARSGTPEAPSLSVTLAVLALLMRDKHGDLRPRPDVPYQSPEELHEHLQVCFTKLAVPRRERERVEGLLHGWLYLSLHSFDSENTRKLPRIVDRDLAADLAALLELLGAESALVHIAEGQAEGTQGQSGRRRRRRRKSPRDTSPEFSPV